MPDFLACPGFVGPPSTNRTTRHPFLSSSVTGSSCNPTGPGSKRTVNSDLLLGVAGAIFVVNTSWVDFGVLPLLGLGEDLGVPRTVGLDVDLGVLLLLRLGFDPPDEGVFRTFTILLVENREGGVVAPLIDNGVVDFVDFPPLGYGK